MFIWLVSNFIRHFVVISRSFLLETDNSHDNEIEYNYIILSEKGWLLEITLFITLEM